MTQLLGILARMIQDVESSVFGVVAPSDIRTFDDLASARWDRAVRLTLAHDWPRSRMISLAALGSAWFVFSSLLVAIGYPTWRTVAFACVGLIGLLPFTLGRFDRRIRSHWVNEEYALTTFFLGSLFTGGIFSPVILCGLPIAATVHTRGLARPTVFRIVAFSIGLALLALAPQSWVGSRPPPPVFATGLLAFSIPTIVLQFQQSTLVGRTIEAMIRQVFRTREEVAGRALDRAQELEMLSSKLSHELKNPLGAVKALVQLSARTAVDSETREQLAVVVSEVARMQTILEEYLSFSRPLATLRPEPLQLADLVDDVLAAVEGRAHAASVVLQRLGDARTSADRRRLTEALLNLVANSIEATPPNGRVAVEIAERQGRIEITVRDTGSGMSPEVLARLGSPFFTTRAQGTGLGVLLARNVFTQHGGALEFQSTPGHGTVAVGSLPARKLEAPDGVCAARR